jgi:hypothetical protein
MKWSNKISNTGIKVRVEPSWHPYFIFVGCKANKTFFLNLFIFCFELHQVYKDWMIKTDEVIIRDDGKKFETWVKNPKYMNEEVKTFAIPKWW